MFSVDKDNKDENCSATRRTLLYLLYAIIDVSLTTLFILFWNCRQILVQNLAEIAHYLVSGIPPYFLVGILENTWT
jgi:hypothetical protein